MLKRYEHEGFFDEMVEQSGKPRPHYRKFDRHLKALSKAELELKRHSMDVAFLRQGITFNVYGDSAVSNRRTQLGVRRAG